jgi:hypothetical protein
MAITMTQARNSPNTAPGMQQRLRNVDPLEFGRDQKSDAQLLGSYFFDHNLIRLGKCDET